MVLGDNEIINVTSGGGVSYIPIKKRPITKSFNHHSSNNANIEDYYNKKIDNHLHVFNQKVHSITVKEKLIKD